jgi:hypothetical protein
VGDLPENYSGPVGWQAVCRQSDDGCKLLIVLHSFQLDSPRQIKLPLPSGDWAIETRFTHDETAATCEDETFRTHLSGSFVGAAYLLSRS